MFFAAYGLKQRSLTRKHDIFHSSYSIISISHAPLMIIWCIRRKKNSHRLYPQHWDIYPAADCNTPASNNIDSVSAIANKVLQDVLESYTLQHHVLSISASIGISRHPENSENVDKLMKQADIAMYKAKQEGKNRFELFDPSME
jgi:hypothetical protein